MTTTTTQSSDNDVKPAVIHLENVEGQVSQVTQDFQKLVFMDPGVQAVPGTPYVIWLDCATPAQAFSKQFTSIIDYFQLLNEVDTTNVPPACETSNTRSVMRPDEILPSMPREDFLKNVPHRDGDFVQVPLVFSEE